MFWIGFGFFITPVKRRSRMITALMPYMYAIVVEQEVFERCKTYVCRRLLQELRTIVALIVQDLMSSRLVLLFLFKRKSSH